MAAAAREAKVSLFHYFFHILHLHWILSLRHFLTQDTSPSYTFPGQLCFYTVISFPLYSMQTNFGSHAMIFFPNFTPFPGSRRMTLRSLRTFHSQISDTGIRDLHCQERLETRVPAIYLTSCFHYWLRMVQCYINHFGYIM